MTVILSTTSVILALLLALVWARKRWGGFTAQRPEDYTGIDGPAFDLRRHLDGPLICDGVIYGPLGRVTSRFYAQINCTWDGDTGVMDELFVYDDGSQQTRAWALTCHADGHVCATAGDVVGTAQGVTCGPAFQMRYRIRLADELGGHVLRAVDWMYLTPNGTITNRSQFYKLGICVAELVATIRCADGGAQIKPTGGTT
ncbi:MULTISPECIES: DUF3833 family protein [Roseobacteraceae]|uniref:DUF3833 domain-containing protein n=1 Tax=Pseudosulfitobacter pseudonitzschiae TaxID=1402135 RepID=A0A221K4A3_9RHOB|nr:MULTISPECIES: DUF3833 family protein [Roseobacteraceae]ASM73667.1 hypothetical protein SULPSESMR1_02886 [Pseudosulfitobacter pseudonitzschiae]